jgi:hypothetical protein
MPRLNPRRGDETFSFGRNETPSFQRDKTLSFRRDSSRNPFNNLLDAGFKHAGMTTILPWMPVEHAAMPPAKPAPE